MPFWGKNSPENCLVDLGRDNERALSPADLFGGKAPVGALIGLLERILLAHLQLRCILYVPL
jgi:hypothetical protein